MDSKGLWAKGYSQGYSQGSKHGILIGIIIGILLAIAVFIILWKKFSINFLFPTIFIIFNYN